MIMAAAFHPSAATKYITYHISEEFMINLKSCPFGKNELKSLDYHLGLGKAWQSGLLQTRESFQRMARTASHSQIGQDRDNKNQLEGSLQSGQWLLQIPQSLALKSHLSGTDWLRELAHRDNESKVTGSSSRASEPTSLCRVVKNHESTAAGHSPAPLAMCAYSTGCQEGKWQERLHSIQKALSEHYLNKIMLPHLSGVSKLARSDPSPQETQPGS